VRPVVGSMDTEAMRQAGLGRSLLNGRPVRIYYDDFGAVEKQKWLD